MSIYARPNNDNHSSFNISNWINPISTVSSVGTPITPAYLDANYVKFPTSQTSLITIPNGDVLNNFIVGDTGTMYADTIDSINVSSDCNLIPNKTSGGNDFNLGIAVIAGETIQFGTSTSTTQIGSVLFSDDAVNPLTNTDALSYGNAQTSGNLQIANNNARTGNINIAKPSGVSSGLANTVNIGVSTSPIVIGKNSATANTTIKYGSKSVNSYSITTTGIYTVPADFPIDGFINVNSVNAYLNIAVGAGTTGFSFRSFSVYSADANFYVVLPAGYTWGGLAKGWVGNNYYLYALNVHSFIVDDYNYIVILSEGNNCLNSQLTIPPTVSPTLTTRGTMTNTYNNAITRTATGAVAFASGATNFTLPQKGLYFFRFYTDSKSSNTTSVLNRVGMGLSILNNTDITFQTALPYLSTYTDCLSFSYKNSATLYSQILTGYYVNNESSPSIVYPFNACGFTNSAGNVMTITNRIECWLVG